MVKTGFAWPWNGREKYWYKRIRYYCILMPPYPDLSHKVPFEEYTKEIALSKLNIAKSIFTLLKNRYELIMEE